MIFLTILEREQTIIRSHSERIEVPETFSIFSSFLVFLHATNKALPCSPLPTRSELCKLEVKVEDNKP